MWATTTRAQTVRSAIKNPSGLLNKQTGSTAESFCLYKQTMRKGCGPEMARLSLSFDLGWTLSNTWFDEEAYPSSATTSGASSYSPK